MPSSLGSLGAVYFEQGKMNRGGTAVRDSIRILEHGDHIGDERLVRQMICLAQLLTLRGGYEEAAALLDSVRESVAADLRAVALNSLGETPPDFHPLAHEGFVTKPSPLAALARMQRRRHC